MLLQYGYRGTIMENAERRLKQLLKEKHVTVDQLAAFTGKNRATIYRYMNGDIANMPTATMKQIAEYLNVNPGYLMGWTDDPSPAVHKYTVKFTYDENGKRISTVKEKQPESVMEKLDQLTEEQYDTIVEMIDMFIRRNNKAK